MVVSTRKTKRDSASRSHLLYPDEEWRSALQDIADNPALYKPTVHYAKEDFVLVKDQKPRASVHLLLLPRDKSKYELHPLTAYSDPAFRAKVEAEIQAAKKIAAQQLQELYEKTASADRDWKADIRAGFHVAPSMNHLHIHVISTDFCNTTAKQWTGREYLAMGIEFFTSLDELPLSSAEPRQKRDKALLDGGELVCWRCRENFGQQTNWTTFKKHLDEEVEVWKKL